MQLPGGIDDAASRSAACAFRRRAGRRVSRIRRSVHLARDGVAGSIEGNGNPSTEALLLARRDKDEVARELIGWHFWLEPEITKIYRVRAEQEDREDEPIKLLEVNRESSETGRVDSFLFDAAGDISYASVVAEVTPRELELIKLDILALPEGWSLARAEEHVRPHGTRANGAQPDH